MGESCWRGHDDLVRSFCVVTVPANADVAPHQERMPLVLEKANLPVWFGEVRGDPAALLRPPPAGTLRLTPRRRPR